MAVYTTDHSPAVLQTHGWRTVTNSVAYLLPYIKPHMTILDIGCGPGSITIDLARHVPQGHVTGIDVPDPLSQARDLANRAGVANIDFRIGDIHNLEFPDNSFDIVHVHQVLQHIADPIRALREMRRVVKSEGGIVAARESAQQLWYPDNERIAKGQELRARVAHDRGGHWAPGRLIHAWAHQAGFDRTRIQKSVGTWCFSTPDERNYWGGSMRTRVTNSGFAAIAVQGGYATKEELEDIAKGWKDWVDDEDGWFVVMHGEILCWK